MTIDDTDRQRLDRALKLAEQSIGLSDPNPRVGCVIADALGVVAGEGFTQRAGDAHAEIHALQAAKVSGRSVEGGTAWVTLEPCAHHGRTPPCCEALVAARLARVVVAVEDPFGQVNGAGIRFLRASGIRVDVLPTDDPLAHLAVDLNIGFFSRVLRARPWVRLKAAQSLDGRVALPNGVSQWITGAPARQDGHAWRRRAGAVLTGIGTVLADRPRMDVRLIETTVQPMRVVLDAYWRTPPDARVLEPPGKALVMGLEGDPVRRQCLEDAGAATWAGPGSNGHLDLHAALSHLASLSVNELHVEAGPALSTSFLQSGLVDELLLYVAPVMLGAGPSVVGFEGLTRPSEAKRWVLRESVPVGSDLRLRLRPQETSSWNRRSEPRSDTSCDKYCQKV